MQTEPPNFGRTYPLAGEKIGPAWRYAWSQLSDSRWTNGLDLAADMAWRAGITAKTAAGLLSKARVRGILSVAYRMDHGRKRRIAFYRVKP